MHATVGHFVWGICYSVVLVGMCFFGLHRYNIVYLFLKYRKNIPIAKGVFSTLPRITVQLPIYNEYYVVERLLKSVGALDYPRELLQIQVLDDSTDETREISEARVRELQAQGFKAELIHRVNRAGFKAGALERGLNSCEGEFILI